jgi:hydrogenase maturation protein HypF
MARGMGRWFDAVGALALGLPRAGFDGHIAIALEEVAGSGRSAPDLSHASGYPVALPAAAGPEQVGEIDLRPTVPAVVADLLDGTSAAVVSTRFHASIVEATSAVVARVLADTGVRGVVLSGGSIQNQLLERGLRGRMAGRVEVASEVPVNDGGIALGQAWAAALALLAEKA